MWPPGHLEFSLLSPTVANFHLRDNAALAFARLTRSLFRQGPLPPGFPQERILKGLQVSWGGSVHSKGSCGRTISAKNRKTRCWLLRAEYKALTRGKEPESKDNAEAQSARRSAEKIELNAIQSGGDRMQNSTEAIIAGGPYLSIENMSQGREIWERRSRRC